MFLGPTFDLQIIFKIYTWRLTAFASVMANQGW